MSKPHGRDCPDRCSQCRADAHVRRVEQQGAELLVDGVPVRPIDLGPDPYVQVPRQQRRNRGKK